jgi:hypothetical protein
MVNHVFSMREQWKSALVFGHVRLRCLLRTSSMVIPSDELHAHGEAEQFVEIFDVRILSFGEHTLNPP